MKDKHRKALLKIAQNPGFFDSFQNWGQSLFDGKSGTSPLHFNNMMKSDAMNNVSSSFNAFTNSAGQFANTFNDGQTGTTWDAFKNMYTGEGAPWAWGTTALAAATMANAFNGGGNSGGGGNNRGGSGLGAVVPWLLLGGLAYGAYKFMPQINKWMTAYRDTAGWREYAKNPHSSEAQNAGVATTKKLRNDHEAASNVADSINTLAKVTGNHGIKSAAYQQINTSPDEFYANSGFGAYAKQFGYWDAAKQWVADRQQMQAETPEMDKWSGAAEAARAAGVTATDYEKMKAAERTGTIVGSMPVLGLTVSAKPSAEFANQGDQQLAQDLTWIKDLQTKGSLSQEAYQKQVAAAQDRYRKRQQQQQAAHTKAQQDAFVAHYNNPENHSGNPAVAIQGAVAAANSVKPPKPPVYTNRVVKPSQATNQGPREFRDGKILVRKPNDPYWKNNDIKAVKNPNAVPKRSDKILGF